jgi:hypothetical protein
MLIAIFALMLVSVVAIALVISSGTDSALAGNYRTSSSAYYAAVAGLEEARGRLLWKNADFINKTGSFTNVLFDASGTQPSWCINKVLYITNPAPGETVDPAGNNPANYQDTEYAQEFPGGLAGATVLPYVPSVSSGVNVANGTLPGPSYKWVRINAVNESALKIDVNGNGNTTDPGTLYYDPAHLNAAGKSAPSLVVPPLLSCPPGPPTPPAPWTSSTAVQALEVTALAVAPNGGQRLLQDIVAPLIISPDGGDQIFPAALTLDGNNVIFQASGAPNYYINGQDACVPLPASVYSIAYTNPADYPAIQAQVTPTKNNYPGQPITPPVPASPPYTPTYPGLLPAPFPPPAPPAGLTSGLLRANWQTPAALESVMQDVVNNADVVITGPATGADILNRAPLMAAASPMTIVVQGDLNLAGWHNTGYGLLLVTGTLYYDPDATWNGLVLVVGQGIVSSSKNGVGGINGSVFVAKTRDAAGNILNPTLGAAFFGSQTSYGSNPGYGINYNSCWLRAAQGPLSYKVISFHEIPLPN